MKVRKLRQEEHLRTRKLWEEIFTEDTPEFVDYYYSVKAKENEIYVIEDGDQIVSMLHLNPYQMRIGNQICQTHYIVGVATVPQYRRRGLMAELLNYVLRVMHDRGEPFTFLMPASEAIYKPFGFEFVYTQGRSLVTTKNMNGEFVFTLATKEECQELAEFANAQLQAYDITTWRTAAYYETVLKEKSSEDGGILLARKDGRLVGVFCFTRTEGLEIQEPLFLNRGILQQAVSCLTEKVEEKVLCLGYGNEEEKPLIMAKVLQPEFQDIFKKAKVFINEVV